MDRRRNGFVDGFIDCSCVATKILKTQRKLIFSENLMTENPENTPFAKQVFPNLIREGGRTVGSGRVATIIE